MTDRLDLTRWDGRIDRLTVTVASMAATTAWAHLRTCGRHGACTVEQLQRYAAGAAWRRAVSALAVDCGERTFRQWRAYCASCDDDAITAQWGHSWS